MRALHLTTLTALVTTALITAYPSDSAAKKPAWEEVTKKKGVTVYNREIEGSGLREVKAVGIVNFPAEHIYKVVSDVDNYVEYMPYLTKVEVVKRTENHVIAYHQFDAPLVDARDYTLKLTWTEDAEKGRYKRSWRTANKQGPGPKKGFVRVDLCNGSWTVQALGPNKSRVTYWLHTDPGGSVPTWIANKGNTISLPDLFVAVR
ncbi:MAG: START domain-containing protein, partial [Myxococcota bacterium]|nr:START domain-containing protein [Myxococcota bacterium]